MGAISQEMCDINCRTTRVLRAEMTGMTWNVVPFFCYPCLEPRATILQWVAGNCALAWKHGRKCLNI